MRTYSLAFTIERKNSKNGYVKIFRSLKQLRHLVSLDIFGVVDDRGLQKLHSLLGSSISLNQQRFSYVARPTYGLRRTSVWGLRTRP